jgi:ParB family chromosome partitioning protein
MKENDKIIKSNLKTLLKRYSRSDAISNLERNYNRESIHKISPFILKTNKYVEKMIYSDEQIAVFADDIKDTLIQPIICRQNGNDVEVVIGLKTLLGARKLNLPTIDCVINNFNDEETLLVIASYLRENENYSVVGEAYILDYLKKDFGYKNKDLELLFKQSASQISNILQLLCLDQSILNLIIQNKLTYGHAKSFCRLEKSEVNYIVKQVLSKNLSVRETERLVQSVSKKSDLNDNLIITKNKITLIFNNDENKENALKRINKLIKKRKIKF